VTAGSQHPEIPPVSQLNRFRLRSISGRVIMLKIVDIKTFAVAVPSLLP